MHYIINRSPITWYTPNKVVDELIDHKEFYDMDKNPHGLCIIINNDKFDHPVFREKAHADRKGAEVDLKNLQSTFQHLNYEVELYENLASSDMTDLMMSIAQRDHAQYDSFVCCILTHGKQDIVYGSDSTRSVSMI